MENPRKSSGMALFLARSRPKIPRPSSEAIERSQALQQFLEAERAKILQQLESLQTRLQSVKPKP